MQLITLPRAIFLSLLVIFMHRNEYSLLTIGVTSILYLAFMALLRKHCDGGVNYHSPNLKGKVIIVTGANSGIGEAAVLHLSTLGPHKIILACRTKSKALETIKKAKNFNPDVLEFMQLDLNDFDSIKGFAAQFKA